MNSVSSTRASLLLRIRNPNDVQAWRQFVDVYASLIYGFLRKRGLQDADAADLVQDVLRSVSGAIGKLEYDRSRGTFRSWLFTITRNKMYSFLESQSRQVRGSGDSGAIAILEEKAVAPDDSEGQWEEEYQRRTFAWAVERIRGEFQESTFSAFWKTAVEGLNPKGVGDELGMTPGAVYVARSRVLARLREEVGKLKDE